MKKFLFSALVFVGMTSFTTAQVHHEHQPVHHRPVHHHVVHHHHTVHHRVVHHPVHHH
ncbi:MAG TPA: hypothetical protein VHE54_09070 [Puia sp.]|nr:hypothetical protein [Puia sp.]